MKRILIAFILLMAITSCKKEVVQPEDNTSENVYVRIESVSKDGSVSYSPIFRVNMRN